MTQAERLKALADRLHRQADRWEAKARSKSPAFRQLVAEKVFAARLEARRLAALSRRLAAGEVQTKTPAQARREGRAGWV